MLLLNFAGIDAFDAERLQEPAQVGIDLALAQMPELDRQLAAEVPDQVDVDPDAGEVLQPAAGDDDAAFLGVGMPARLEVIGEAIYRSVSRKRIASNLDANIPRTSSLFVKRTFTSYLQKVKAIDLSS
jgi:hypothetical protein